MNWAHASEYDEDVLGVPQVGGGTWPWHLDTFHPLLGAYLLSGDEAYLAKWAAFADDWAMHQEHGVASLEAATIPDTWTGGADRTIDYLRYLAGMSRVPGSEEALPAATFARVLDKLVRDYLPTTMMYLRSNPQNWTDASVPSLVEIAFLLDEYHVAPLYLVEARRRMELLIPTRHMPDGTDSELLVGYNGHYMIAVDPTLSMLKNRMARIPAWLAPPWERELRESWRLDDIEREQRAHMQQRMRYLVGYLMPHGEWPVGGARADRRNRSQHTYQEVLRHTPELLAEPDVYRILAHVRQKGGALPSFNSEWFPYAGYYIMRTGWHRDDPYLFMISPPQPGVGNLGAKDNNAFGLYGYGQDLIVPGEVGPYGQNNSPIRVDGHEQFAHAGNLAWGHRNYMVNAWDTPPARRWHDS
ncbi:MAG: hypothetical protein WD079_01720, partial [Phycisphaeraceae bacterium]